MKNAGAIAVAALALIVSGGTTGTAAAQNIFGEPGSGTVTLQAGFEDDPRTIAVTSGGPVDTSETIGECSGFIAEDPDVRLTFTADDQPNALPLFISVSAEGDTTLVINAPDGSWYCNDDGQQDNFNPSIVFGPAQTGDYEIWVGSFEEGQFHDSEVRISELGGQ